MNALLVLLIIFSLLMLSVAGKSGLQSLLGLGLNFAMIFIFLALTSWGAPILLVLPVLSFSILTFSIFTSTPDEQVSTLSFKVSLIVLSVLFFLAFAVQHIGQFQGFSEQNMDELLALSASVGISFSNLAITVFVISLLGAVAETSMTVVINLKEIIKQNPEMTVTQFKVQQKIVAQQTIGTAINVLFFGLLGSSLAVFLWFLRLNLSLAEMVNSKLLMMEVAIMLLGMIGLLVAVELSVYFVEKELYQNKEVD